MIDCSKALQQRVKDAEKKRKQKITLATQVHAKLSPITTQFESLLESEEMDGVGDAFEKPAVSLLHTLAAHLKKAEEVTSGQGQELHDGIEKLADLAPLLADVRRMRTLLEKMIGQIKNFK